MRAGFAAEPMRFGWMIDPFFIVGSGRSGTTLLRSLLCRHSKIHIPPETWFILDLIKRVPRGRPLTEGQVHDAIEAIISSYRWPDFQINPDLLRANAATLVRPTLVDIINLVYAELRETTKPRLGDKTPPYIQIVPELAELYPDAVFVHLIRDGRDVACSFLDIGFYDKGSRFYDGAAFEWTTAIRLGRMYHNSPYATRVLEVRYEQLVMQPERTLSNICSFLGENFESEMLERRGEPIWIPPRERDIHPKLSGAISPASVATWRRKLTPVECFAMEACLGRDLRLLEYPLLFRSAGWRPLLFGVRLLLQKSSSFLANVLSYARRRGFLHKKLYF